LTKKNVHKTKSQGWIKRFMAFSDKPAIQVIAPFLFVWMFTLSFGQLQFGIAMTLSMVLHELGHAYVLKENGILWKILWLFPLGAVAAPLNEAENKRSDLLAWWKLTWLMLAGPAVNVGLMFVGVLLTSINPVWSAALITTNGYLLVINLIPVGSLDAGQHFKLIFTSLNEREEKVLLTFFAAIMVVFFGLLSWSGYGSILLTLVMNIGWVALIPIIVIAVFSASMKDDETLSESPLAMTNTQAAIATLSYMGLVLAMLVMWVGPLVL